MEFQAPHISLTYGGKTFQVLKQFERYSFLQTNSTEPPFIPRPPALYALSSEPTPGEYPNLKGKDFHTKHRII